MKHPLENAPHKKTYDALCKRYKSFYGVEDAERFYKSYRQSLLDKCATDKYSVSEFPSLLEWHDNISFERGTRSKLEKA